MKQRKRGIRRMFAGAMAALMMLSVVDVSGWGVMNAKAEETAVQVNDSAGKTEQQSTEVVGIMTVKRISWYCKVCLLLI